MAAAHRCSLIMLKCEEVNACQGFDSALVGIRILFSELVGMQTLPLKAPLATQPTCPLEGSSIGLSGGELAVAGTRRTGRSSW
jgi:hypothetical protein